MENRQRRLREAHRASNGDIMTDEETIIETCANRIEPVKVQKTFHKADLERLLNVEANIQHILGCTVRALLSRYDVSELIDLLHVYVDELATIGRKKE